MPIITSLSTRFLGQPKLTKPTFVGTICRSGARLVFCAGIEETITAKGNLFYFIIRRAGRGLAGVLGKPGTTKDNYGFHRKGVPVLL